MRLTLLFLGVFIASIDAFAQPANNNKANALELTQRSNWCSSLAAYTNVGATTDGSYTSCGNSYNDVWFKFQATTSYIKFDVRTGSTEGTISSPEIVLWNSANSDVACANSTSVSGGDVSIETSNLVVGEWYHISVYTSSSSSSNQGTFSICANDQATFNFRSGAIELTQRSNWCSTLAAYSNVGATADGPTSSCGAPNNNVWFKFQSTTGYIKFDVKTGSTEGTISSPEIALWNSTNADVVCANSTSVSGGDVSIEASNLAIGEWYYISVYTNGSSTSNQGTFSVCANDQPTFNFRPGAVELTQRNNWCSALAAYSNVGATPDGSTSSCGAPANNVWFKFQSTTGYMKFDVKTGGTEGTISSPEIALWNSANSEVTCANANFFSGPNIGDVSIEVSNLVIGGWYYISVYTYDNSASYQGTFSICVNDQPTFNFRPGAIELTQRNNWCSPLATYTNVGATADGSSTSCGSPYSDVWFKFQAATDYIKFDVKTGGAEGTIPSPEIVLWNSANSAVTCANSTVVSGGDVSIEAGNLIVGEWYYISVYTNGSSSQGTFSICANDKPPFNFKSGAVELTQRNNWCSALAAYSNVGATGDGPGSGLACGGTPTNNVWFKFQATTGYVKVDVKTGSSEGTIQSPVMTLWSSAGTNVVCTGRDNSSSGDISVVTGDLTVGEWYYLSVYTSDGTNMNAPGTFTLCVNDQPTFDYRIGALELTQRNNWCSALAAYSNVGATGDGPGSGLACGGTPTNNVWFKFQATTGYVKVDVKTGSSEGTIQSPVMTLWSSAGTNVVCTGRNNSSSGDISVVTGDLAVGEWYYLSVNTSDGTSENAPGTFTLCVNDQPTFDYRVGAVELVQRNNWCSALAAYTNVGATSDGTSSDCGQPYNNVWFKFQSTTGYIKFDVKTGSTEGTVAYPEIALFSSNNTRVACSNNNNSNGDVSIEKFDLTEGEWYYISVYTNHSSAVNQGTFTICVNDKPSFDYRAGALEFNQKNNWCSALAAYNNVGSTSDGPTTSACGIPNNNVWFKFQAATPYMKLDVKTGGSEGTIVAPEIAIWNNINSEVICANSTGPSGDVSIEKLDLTIGQWYYVSVYTSSLASSQGTFTVCVNDQPSFDHKIGARELVPMNKWCSALMAYSSVNATPDGAVSSCGNPNNNVWFKFQAATSFMKFEVKTGSTEGTILSPEIAMWASNNTEVVCTNTTGSSGDVSIEKDNLTIGQWYYISVYTEAVGSNVQGTFSVCYSNNAACLMTTTIFPLTSAKTCSGLSIGSVTLTGSETGVTYTLSNGQQKIGTGSALTWNNLSAGAYSITAQRSTCDPVNIGNITVLEYVPITAKVVSAGLPVFCEGSSVPLLAFSEDGYSFQWLNDINNVPTPISGATQSHYQASVQGTYRVSVTQNGCNKISDPLVVTTTAKPVATITPSGATTFCQGNSVVLNASTGANYTYQWKTAEGDIKNATSSTYTVTQSGTYKLVTKIGSCSTESAAQVIVVNPIPTVSVVSSGPSAVCQGNTITLLAIGQADSYQWKKGGSVISGQTATSYVVSEANSFKVTATLGVCSSESNVITTTIKPIPAPVTSLTGPATIPAGDKLSYAVTGAASNDVYLWNTPAGTNITYGDGKRTSATLGFNQLGEKIITVTAQKDGCESTPVEKTIQVIEAVTSIPSQIPADLKVTPTRQTIPALTGSTLRLNTFNQDDVKQVFETCVPGEYYVAFQLNYDALADFNTVPNWKAIVDVTLMQGASTILWTRSMQVDMASQTFISTIFHDTPLNCTGDYRFKIKTKSTNFGGVQAPEQNLYLKVLLYKRMTGTFVPSTAVSLDYRLLNGKVETNWSYTGDAVKGYDLEWVLMEDYENFTGTAQQAFLAKEPVRVTTGPTDFTYKHHNFYPKGKMWFRARAIGYNPLYPQHTIPGQWSYGPATALVITNPQGDKNWQMQTVFAEEGKYKKIVTYYDGTLRQRQAQTNLSTDDQTLVAETMYDFEGRKSIDVLPVPASEASLTYKSNFNAFQTASDATVLANTSTIQKKFNYDNRQLVNSILSQANGAGRYYSEVNTIGSVTQGPKGYVPDADGYAYSQTEYLNDGTGRVTRQSGVGEIFKMDGERTTRYYYAEAARMELVRLFGPNVGNASHYKKNVVVDPNGQVSVSYVDQTGQVIATALAGTPPTTVDPLPSYQALPATAIAVDLNSKNSKASGISKTVHKFLNEGVNTPYTFNYDLSALGNTMAPLGCQACSYDLMITITDPDGKLVNLGTIAGNQSGNTTSFERRDLTAANCATIVSAVQINLTLTEVGDYTLTKTLTPRELTIEQMKTAVKQSAAVQQQILAIESSYVVNPEDCAICTTCDGDKFIDEAINEIADLDCENILQDIIQDLKRANGSPDFEPTDDVIKVHALYCKYELCVKDKASDVFEKQMARVDRWSVASSASYRYDLIADVDNSPDPFFSEEELTGYSERSVMKSKINAAGIKGTPYTGSLLQVTDPLNTNYYVNTAGQSDPNGYHILYFELMRVRRGQIGETAYQQELDVQRWSIFRGLYLEAKRLAKLEMPAYSGCAKAREALLITDGLPQGSTDMVDTRNRVTQWGKNYDGVVNGIDVDITDEELETHIASLNFKCGVTLTAAHAASITGYLRTYFNNNVSNFFRVILQTDIGVNANLVAIQNILASYNCKLDSVAEQNPVNCSKTFSSTFPSFGPNIISNPQFTGCPVQANITTSCSGWAPAYGTPFLMSDKGFQLEATNCAQDAIRGTFTAPLVPGQKYRLKFKYKSAAGNTEYSGIFLSRSTQFDASTPALRQSDQQNIVVPMIAVKCPVRPRVVSVDMVKFDDTSTSYSTLWSTYSAGTSYTDVEVIFSPVSPSTYIYFTHLMNDESIEVNDIVFKDVEVMPLLNITLPSTCLEYSPLTSWAYEADWAAEVARCNERAQVERTDLIAFATEEYLEDQASEFLANYRSNCLNLATEQLKYTYIPKEYHYTLYYYDQANNLVQTVPPEGVKPLTVPADIASATPPNPLHKLVTRYQYSSINQVSSQSTPDAGVSEFLYDKKGQLRLSRNAQQTVDTKYSYTKYDRQGRVTEVGELTAAVPTTTIAQYVDDARFPTTGVAELPTYPTADVTKTYYDFVNETIISKLLQQNVRNRVSWVEVTDKNSANKSLSYYSYDIHGNVKSLLQHIPGLEAKRTDYVYDLVSGKVNYVFYQFGKADQFIHKYTYDADNRIKTTSTSSDAYLWYQEASYKYYAHGPLARTEVGEYRVQGQDYYYTLQGWIKGVNMPFDGDPGADGITTSKVGKDVYAYTLGYYQNDYKASNAAAILSDTRDQQWARYTTLMGNTGLYNGNISWMVTDLAKIGEVNSNRAKGMQAMLYRYDQLHRIKKSQSLSTYAQGSGFATRTATPAPYDENYAYDGNGNITTLNRYSATSVLTDDFAYQYYTETNKLRKVKAADGDYVYDAIGNLITDNVKGVTISWTPYGKVREVRKNGGTEVVSYLYDAAGSRVSKSVVISGTTTVTHYVRDASGNTMGTYVNTTLTEQPMYGSSRLGLYKGVVTEGALILGKRNFELSNHLGNVLAVITDNINFQANNATAKVINASDYYPFGLEMSARTYSDATAYRYGFNGKEKDNFGDAVYDYGFRIYNPRIVRFLSSDPLTKEFPDLTPYQFAGNCPVRMIDLDGLEPADPFDKFIDLSRDFRPQTTKSLIAAGLLNNVKPIDGNYRRYVTRLGRIFEDAVIRSSLRTHNTRIFRPMLKNPDAKGVIPDMVANSKFLMFDPLGKGKRITFKDAAFFEAKFKSEIPSEPSENPQQLKTMIDVLSQSQGGWIDGKWNSSIRAADYGMAGLTLITPANTIVDNDLIQYATQKNVQLLQRTTEEDSDNSGRMRVGTGIPLNVVKTTREVGNESFSKGTSVEINWNKR